MEKLFVFGDFNWFGTPKFIGELCYEKLRGADSYAFKFDADIRRISRIGSYRTILGLLYKPMEICDLFVLYLAKKT